MVLGQIGLFTLVLLLSIAFLLLSDRKVWAGVMMRKGPNVVGPFGLLQSFADFGKFLLKEIVIPAGANKFVFLFAPILTCTLAFAAWSAIPVAPGTVSGTSWVISNLNVEPRKSFAKAYKLHAVRRVRLLGLVLFIFLVFQSKCKKF